MVSNLYRIAYYYLFPLVLAAAIAFFSYNFLMGKEHRSEDAVKSGVRAVIDIETGEVRGKKKATDLVPVEAEDDTTAGEEPSPEAETTEEPTPDSNTPAPEETPTAPQQEEVKASIPVPTAKQPATDLPAKDPKLEKEHPPVTPVPPVAENVPATTPPLKEEKKAVEPPAALKDEAHKDKVEKPMKAPVAPPAETKAAATPDPKALPTKEASDAKKDVPPAPMAEPAAPLPTVPVKPIAEAPKLAEPAPTAQAPAPTVLEKEQPKKPAHLEKTAEEIGSTPPVAVAPDVAASLKGTETISTQKTKYVAILITGLGLSSIPSGQALELPPEVTMGFSPYTSDIDDWVERAVKRGHEVFLGLPMEPQDYPISDPGPYALISSLSDTENLERLHWILEVTKGYAGVYSPRFEKFTFSLRVVHPILEELKKRGVSFVYGGDAENYSLLNLTDQLGVPTVGTDYVIDETITPSGIAKALKDLETVADKNGYAVGVGRPYPVTTAMLREWLMTLDAKNIRLVPVSELLSHKKGS
ncbi:MAG: hypothetical protein K0R63_1674 [Rickettsiales bacterium]|jgi:polysaccharide deacetylase 2 family uncharacterized protein YibQ|nr:hypothetical protein [Rickettsiales bacterium]